MPKIEARTRCAIAEFLPHAIETALASYRRFAEDEATTPEENKAKEFKAHHDACKIAIAHIELLIKLARWADLPDPEVEDANHQAMLQSLIENAEKELGREQ
ncbi:MAG: hypothetical protein KDI46_01665 [Alphaproteobacteria bacterium]|nr:hypothetical protein [Alphaproteobacteria bacterium]